MKFLSKLLAVGMLLSLTSCAVYYPVSISSNQIGTKRAHGCVTTILGFLDFGQNNTHVTAKGAGITKLTTVDYKVVYYPFVTRSCTYVSGN